MQSSAAAAPNPLSEINLKERFFRYFQHEVTALQEQMARLQNTSPAGGELNDAIDHCHAGIDRLSHEVKDASSYIPAYDQRTYAEAIKALTEKLQGIRTASLGGRKKFTFKTARKNESAISLADAVELARGDLKVPSGFSSMEGSSFVTTPLDKISPSEEKLEEEFLGVKSREANGQTTTEKGVSISNHADSHVILPPSATDSTRTGTVTGVRHSVVDLSPPTTNGGHPFANLILRNVKDSLIVCGQVSGPIHVTGIENSVLVVSSRQFRMHGSKNVDVYLHCSSRPIIEDCENIRFAPIPAAFTTEETLASQNQWDQIDDFKWLKAEPSPHFSLLLEAERVKDDMWKETVPGGHGATVDDLLRGVGVVKVAATAS
ncbi:tubulin-specific chaperone c [Byssothecium circinans]|uniref:Tubulin-specific chaperone c n=1 Tax=Byssothecium circinans TaxID=147558 RepID=A0A6A5TWG9_9PLEO|nr:tubulin-specific chaperone c [Byssothecium circinans]